MVPNAVVMNAINISNNTLTWALPVLQTTKQNISSEGSVIKKTNAVENLTSGKFWGLLSTFSKNGNFDINIKEQKDTEIHEALCKNWQTISSQFRQW